MALKKAKVIAVTSVKGGTGKTTTVLNLAGILSKQNQKTLILDLDLYSGSIAASLNLNQNKDIYTMCDDMINNRFKEVEDYVQAYNEYIDVIPCPIDPRSVSKISTNYLEIIISRLVTKYDVILIDTNHVMDANKLIVLDNSDEVLYIMTNDLMDIKNMKTMVSIFSDMQLDNFKIIVNAARLNNANYDVSDIESLLETKVDYLIPRSFYNRNIEKYIYEGKIMTLNHNSNKIFENIIDNIIKE